MGFGQDRLTPNKLSILNGVHIMTLHTVSHFDSILPQNLHDPGRREKEGFFSLGFGFSRAEKEFVSLPRNSTLPLRLLELYAT